LEQVLSSRGSAQVGERGRAMFVTTNVEAHAVRTIDWLSAPDTRLAVPVYQRQYRWDMNGCRRLLDDIRAVADKDEWQTHFIGSILAALRGHVESDHRRRGRELYVPALIPVEQPRNGGQKVTSGSPKKSEMKLTKKKPKNTTLTSSSTVCHHFGRAVLGSLRFR
jgi:hypothetical protein